MVLRQLVYLLDFFLLHEATVADSNMKEQVSYVTHYYAVTNMIFKFITITLTHENCENLHKMLSMTERTLS